MAEAPRDPEAEAVPEQEAEAQPEEAVAEPQPEEPAEAQPEESAAEPQAEGEEPDDEAQPAPAEQADAPSHEAAAPPSSDGPGVEEVRGWRGFKLDEIGGNSVGKIEGAFADEASGRPEWLLARMGRFGHHTLVPARDAVAGAGRVWVPYSRDFIRKAPRVDPGKPLDRDQEQALLDHYGIGTADAGRGAQLADRDRATITARPD
jgi:hypothetical protein